MGLYPSAVQPLKVVPENGKRKKGSVCHGKMALFRGRRPPKSTTMRPIELLCIDPVDIGTTLIRRHHCVELLQEIQTPQAKVTHRHSALIRPRTAGDLPTCRAGEALTDEAARIWRAAFRSRPALPPLSCYSTTNTAAASLHIVGEPSHVMATLLLCRGASKEWTCPPRSLQGMHSGRLPWGARACAGSMPAYVGKKCDHGHSPE